VTRSWLLLLLLYVEGRQGLALVRRVGRFRFCVGTGTIQLRSAT
jgi:hypothetical protein